MPSIWDPLRQHDLTTAHVRHDWRTGKIELAGLREWSPDQSFAGYRRTFEGDSLLPQRVEDDHRMRESYRLAGGPGEVLGELEALLRAGRHQGVDLWLHAKLKIGVISNMHSDVLGRSNGRHAIRAGGIRRHGRDEDELEVIADGLNLARAMTFKNAAAKIPYGGSKICVVADPIALDDEEALGFLAYCIDRSRSFTGPDMGFVPEHADALRSRFTQNIVGGPGGALGPTGGPTATGVALALEEAAQSHLGRGLRGLLVAVQGLGAVGAPLAHALLAAGARLQIADVDPERLAEFRSTLAADAPVEVVDPEAILFGQVDVVSPNALGAVLGPDPIDRLRCKIVMGAANNQLQAASQATELELAQRLHERGILYQIDWMHNSAGVLAGCEEWEHQSNASDERLAARVEQVCREGVRANLAAAKAANTTPTHAAYAAIEAQIYG